MVKNFKELKEGFKAMPQMPKMVKKMKEAKETEAQIKMMKRASVMFNDYKKAGFMPSNMEREAMGNDYFLKKMGGKKEK